MNKKLSQLLDSYLENKFQPGTGSEDWWDLKTELLVIDDFIVGSTIEEDLSSVDQKQLLYFQKRLSDLVTKIQEYNTVDEDESNEKIIVEQRARYGLEIINHIVKELNVNLN